MEYYKIFSLICLIKSWEVASITTRIEHHQKSVRNFRRHAGPSPPSDWELGLKEAAHQALLREHHNADPGIRDQLLDAPLIGRHDGASPFGDIAVLARGQLYGAHNGFKFVQDQDDCSDKHGCQQWQSVDYSKLLALWTVKRIRHRDPKHGYVFEIEYTISPITPAINEEIHRHGFFNYNVPGHIFVIKSDPRLNSAYYANNNKQFHEKWHPQSDQQEQHVDNRHNQGAADNGNEQFKPGILIGIAPNGYKHILHSLPGFYTSYHPSVSYPDQTTIDPKEYELYKKLIESLASKTTPQQNGYADVPHRFAVTTSTTAKVPIKPQYYPESGFVHFPSDASLSTNSITTSTTSKYHQNNEYSSNPVRFPLTTTGTTKYSEPDMVYHTLAPTVPVVLHQHSDIFDDPVRPPVTQLTTASKTTAAQTAKYPERTTEGIFTTKIETVPTRTTQFTQAAHSELPPIVGVFTTKPQTVPTRTTQFTQSTNPGLHTSVVPSFGTKIPESTAVPVQTTRFVESTSILSTVPKTSSFPTHVTYTHPTVYQSTPRENPQTNQPETTYLTTTRRIPQTTFSHAPTTTRRIPPKTTSQAPQPIHEPETTIYYYTPVEEEVQFSAPPKTSKKPTTSKKIKTTTTRKYTTTKAPLPEIVDEFDVFPAIEPTEAMKPETDSNKPLETTQASIENIYPSSLNDQLPKPEKNTETTIPYVSSTVTQATITSSPITHEFVEEKHTIPTTTINEHAEIETENILSTELGPSTLYEKATEDTRTSTTQEKITTVNTQKENEKITTATIDVESTLPEKEETHPFGSTTNIYTAFNTKNPFETTEIDQMLSTTGRITTLPTTVTEEKETEVISTLLDTTKYPTRPSSTLNSLEFEKTDRMSTSPEPSRTTLQDYTTLNHIKTTTTQKMKPLTTSDDFFNDPEINNYSKQPGEVINRNKDVNEDDIFGQAPSTSKPHSSSTKKQIVQSDLADALFGGRRAKQIKVSSVLTTTTPFVTPKVIYSNFYAPSTELVPTSPYFETTPHFVYETSRNVEETTTELRPITDTSVSTSISFEVNKRNSTRPVLHLEPTIMAHVTEIVDPKNKFKIYKAELPRTTTEKVVETETTKKVFDDFALQLVNHAKTIDYLNTKKTSTSRQPKYKRRRYDPKRRASQRRIS